MGVPSTELNEPLFSESYPERGPEGNQLGEPSVTKVKRVVTPVGPLGETLVSRPRSSAGFAGAIP